MFSISNFRRVQSVVSFLGNFPASKLYMLTFQNTLFHLHRPMKIEQSVPKRPYIKFRRGEITQKKTHTKKY
jgi:hypothetical protein